MTPKQLELIETRLLHRNTAGCVQLIGWLDARGWRMTLLEVEQERARRGIPYDRKANA